MDRQRQNWLISGCDKNSVYHKSLCSTTLTSQNYEDEDESYTTGDRDKQKHSVDNNSYYASSRVLNYNSTAAKDSAKMGVSGIIVIIFIITMVSGLGAWIFYAYRNPHTTSGQMLIRVSKNMSVLCSSDWFAKFAIFLTTSHSQKRIEEYIKNFNAYLSNHNSEELPDFAEYTLLNF